MHDGYVFTIGISGSASASSPAPAYLNAMLGALPPVKRAAMLGEILVSDGLPSLDDPMLAPIRQDIADAELILLVTPLNGQQLPQRIQRLAEDLIAQPLTAKQRYATLIILGKPSQAAQRLLHELCAAANAQIMGELHLPAHDEHDAANEPKLSELARLGYAAARRDHPAALPQ